MKTSPTWLASATRGFLACALSFTLTGTVATAQTFDQAAEHLDTDGDFLAFADFTDDSDILGEHLTAIYAAFLEANPEMTPMPLDFAAIFAQLGFQGISGVGYSSIHLGDDLYRNRGVTLLTGEPKGLVRMYDLTPRTFRAAEIAPPDATLALDLALDFNALSESTLQIAASIMGPMGQGMVQGGLQQPLLPSGLTGQDLIGFLSNPITLVMRQGLDIENEQPILDFYVEVAGAGDLIDHLSQLNQVNPAVTVQTVDGATVVDLGAFTGGQIGLLARRADGDDKLVLFSGAEFEERIASSQSLADTPEFQRVTAHLPEQAAGFTYQNNPMMGQVLEALRAQPEMQPYIPVAEMAITRLIGDFLGPQASAYYEVDGGIASEAYASYSFKEALVLLPAAVIGGVAAGATGAFMENNQSAVEKQVQNNLRQFSSAAQQYMLETGSEMATYEDLVGPGKYIEAIEPVAGESYEDLIVTADDTVLSVELADGTVVTYEF